MTPIGIGTGYFVSIYGGWLLSGVCVYIIRKQIGDPREFFRWLDLWVGGTERIIATTLVIWKPTLLSVFVGGWVLLKMATHWQRENRKGAQQSGLAALVGNAVSFAVAIAVGLVLQPTSLAAI